MMTSTSKGFSISGTMRRDDVGDVAVLILDNPAASANIVDAQVFEDLRAQLDDIEADPSVAAIVIASGKDSSFGAGANVTWLPELAARPDAEQFLASVHDLMYRIVDSPLPVVTAVHGFALGGALELALAGDAIVAAPDASLGLPEVTLGLLPGGGGTQLIRRWLPTDSALDLMLSGSPLGAQDAHAAGMVAKVVPRNDLVPAAVAHARSLIGAAGRPVIESPADGLHAPSAKTTPPGAAAAWIREAVRIGIEDGVDAGLAIERRAFLELIPSPESKARVHLFLAEGAAKRHSRSSAVPATSLAVVGGGQMGSGISATAVSRGLPAVVRDVTDEKLDAARAYVMKVLSRSDTDPARAAERASIWSGTTGWGGFAHASAVVEAVFELPELKRETLAAITGEVASDALIATNTSAIPIETLAGSVDHAERFIGMHFFSPVERMPLVELIPHGATAPETITRASALARQLGKTPIVVGDFPGFFTSRVYARWLIEGVRLLLDGVPAADVEIAALAAGFPVGPLLACDEATLDLVLKASVTQVADTVMADRLDVGAVRGALEALVTAEIEGRRQGNGFYLYDKGRRVGLNPEVSAVLGVTPNSHAEGEVRDRLLLAFASECFLCLDEGVICHPDDGDVASVLGIGFPRALGGPFHWASAYGLGEIIARAAELDLDAFPVGETVAELHRLGETFASVERRTTPARAS